MSETPRHESNGSGPRQHRKNSGGKDFSHSKKGGKNLAARAVSSVTTAEARSSTAVAPTPDPRHLGSQRSRG